MLKIGAGRGCPPLLDIDMGYHYAYGVRLKCYDRTNSLYQKLINEHKPQKVFLSFAQNTLFDIKVSFFDVRGDLEFSADRYNSIYKAMLRTVKYYSDDGIEVVLIEDLPDITFAEFESCLFWENKINKCIGELQTKPNKVAYDSLLYDLSREGIQILRTRKSLESFPFIGSSRKNPQNFLYRDGTHLSEIGSVKVIESSFLE